MHPATPGGGSDPSIRLALSIVGVGSGGVNNSGDVFSSFIVSLKTWINGSPTCVGASVDVISYEEMTLLFSPPKEKNLGEPSDLS